MPVQLTSEQVELLTIHLVRDLDTLRASANRIKERMWDANETFELACWQVATRGFENSGNVMPRDIFEIELRACLQREHPSHGLAADKVDLFLSKIFSFNEKALCFSLVRPLLEEFLVARQVAQQMSSLMMGGSDYITVIENMSHVVAGSRLSSAKPEDLHAARRSNVFAVMERRLTGCKPFDDLIGGIYPGQTIGLLGPMKGGKTSFLQSIASDFIRSADDARVTYMTYEESVDRLLPKMIISFMNRHHRDTLEGKPDDQIDPAVLRDVNAAHDYIAGHLSLMDMSGARAGQGLGGAAEMVTTIENLRRNGQLGQLVIVDHVLPLVRSYANSTGKDLASTMRHLVADVCNQFKQICEQLGITGILAHQMDAKGNSSAKHVPSHMDAAECKLFAEVLHDTLCLGKKTEDKKHLAWLNLSATRTREEKRMWVHIAGHRCRVCRTDKKMTVDRNGMPITEEESVHGRTQVDESGATIRPGFALGHSGHQPFGDKVEE